MGCLEVKLTCLNTTPFVEIDNKGGIVTSIENIGETLLVGITNKSANPKITIYNMFEGLNILFSIVCSVAEIGNYLQVSPKDIQWITEDTGVIYDVKSNVNWIITTN